LIGIIWAFLPPRRPPAIASLPFENEARQFNRWLLVSIFSTTIFTNIDVHVLAYFYPSEVVAQLGAVSRLTLPITILVTSLSTTMLPRLSRNANDLDLFQYYLRKLKLVLPFSILGFVIMGAAIIPLLGWLAGSRYHGLEPLIALQLVSILIVLITNPLGLLVIAEGRTKILAFMNLAQLFIGIGLNLFLVPKLGAIGSICASIGINTIGMITTIFLIRRRLFN
jgi:O-antigen/teichoic acid export membrane protein